MEEMTQRSSLIFFWIWSMLARTKPMYCLPSPLPLPVLAARFLTVNNLVNEVLCYDLP